MSHICGTCRRLHDSEDVIQETGCLDSDGSQLYTCRECHNAAAASAAALKKSRRPYSGRKSS